MKNLASIVLFALAAASCTTKNENSALVITKVVPPTASVTGSGATAQLSCAFDTGKAEFTPDLPFNPSEDVGFMAAVVQNNLEDTTSINPQLRTDSNTFLPHQVVIDYEVVSGGAAAPGQNIVPTSGVVIPAGTSGGVGFSIFNGITMTGFAAGTYIRTSFHVEGKLLDGTTVHTAEREYVFQICSTPGCSLGGYYSVLLPGTTTIGNCF